jgi:hypothetical protein
VTRFLTLVGSAIASGAAHVASLGGSIRAFKEQSVSIADKRIDISAALATALGGELALLSRSEPDHTQLLIITSISVFALLAIGASAYFLALDRDIVIVDYIHARNRIRAYFTERDSIIGARKSMTAYPCP